MTNNTVFDTAFAAINTFRNLSPTLGALTAIGGVTVGLAIANKRPFDQAALNDLIPKNLVFPSDLENYPLSMSFDIMEYKRRSIFKQAYIKPKGTIRLPVAKNIQDSFNMSWSRHNQTPVVGAATEQLLSTGPILGTGSAATSVQNLLAGIGSSAQGLAQGLGIEQLKRDVEGFGKSLDTTLSLSEVLQPLGLAVNPFLTVLFKQPEFKQHSFKWKFIPRTPEEAITLNKIITIFKWALLPDIANETSGTLLNYPNMIQIGFMGADNFLYRFKPSVIEKFNVHYAPAATPSFFKGSQNVPTEIDIDMSLLEIEYWTKKDFDPYNTGVGHGGYSPITNFK